MSDEFSRYETNRRVKQILVSRNVDMTKINYSCVNKTIHFYGSLSKLSQEDLSLPNIEALVSELMNLPHVSNIQFDLDNWFISAEPGDVSITRVGGKSIDKHQGKKDQSE
ncbi:MAG: hypothetical protein CVU62_09060 [Deltaproteobacteria bacterium HGW-Deltaproteobacteria-2]|jgi:hypothetical protein|nr:MAG: hypothetical protein CVU62_09060 [Deltaproteobacteria bacterium HGW-Deltaproteobacteria-2]